jgi:hypothetical protein
MLRLVSCQWVHDRHNVHITGPPRHWQNLARVCLGPQGVSRRIYRPVSAILAMDSHTSTTGVSTCLPHSYSVPPVLRPAPKP